MGSVDHLVVLAASLAEGEQWCRRVLGVTPAPGGEHPLMGTHNLLLNVSGAGFARTYMEIISVKPG
jgi:Glyoxalase-like domain